MTDTAVTTEIHQALDIHRNLTPQIALDRELRDLAPQFLHFGLGQLTYCDVRVRFPGGLTRELNGVPAGETVAIGAVVGTIADPIGGRGINLRMRGDDPDLADTLALLKELDSPVYRWPGGNFVSGYNWEDGVGDRDRRPPRKNPAWKGIESNDFGLHEFIRLCR